MKLFTRKKATDDLAIYRAGYPGKKDDPKANKNLLFYSNQLAFTPGGDYVDNIHKMWWGRYDMLERSHCFIQWLFPIREPGLNREAQELQLHEAQAIASNPVLLNRVFMSYRLMLDFYGLRLVDPISGQVDRHPHSWKPQYSNWLRHPHNNLRVTRILKCLGELNLEHLKKPFLLFILHEVLVTKELAGLKGSATGYWVGTLRHDSDRAEVEHFIASHKHGK